MDNASREWSFLGFIFIILIVAFWRNWYIITIPIYIVLFILALQWPSRKTPVLIAVFTIILVNISLVIYYLFIRSKTVVYPPVVEPCPNTFYPLNGDGSSNCRRISNYFKNGSERLDEIDFSNMNFCDKYAWAKANSLSWTGITNSESLKTLCLNNIN